MRWTRLYRFDVIAIVYFEARNRWLNCILCWWWVDDIYFCFFNFCKFVPSLVPFPSILFWITMHQNSSVYLLLLLFLLFLDWFFIHTQQSHVLSLCLRFAIKLTKKPKKKKEKTERKKRKKINKINST